MAAGLCLWALTMAKTVPPPWWCVRSSTFLR